jgi:hypothetical protein
MELEGENLSIKKGMDMKRSFNAPIEWTPKTSRFTGPIQGEDE